MAVKQPISFCSTQEIRFSTPTKMETALVHFKAEAAAWQDAKCLYLELNVIGLQTEPALRLPGTFMGPLPIYVAFEARPLSFTDGMPVTMSSRLDARLTKFISYDLDCDSQKVVFFGVLKCLDGEGHAQDVAIPTWSERRSRLSRRKRRTQCLPCMSTRVSDFGHQNVHHVFRFHKPTNSDLGEITLGVRMEGEVGYFAADWKSFCKPYKYTFQDIKSSEQTFSVV